MMALWKNDLFTVGTLGIILLLVTSGRAQQSFSPSPPVTSSSLSGSASASASSIATPPTCALLCLETLVLKSSCPISNVTCICTNTVLDEAIAACVTANCTIREQLMFDKYSHNACGYPVVNNERLVDISGPTCGALALLAWLLRIVAKLRGAGGQMGLDDLCLGFAMMICIPFIVFIPILANLGLGKDIWEVPFDNITQILYIYYWNEMIYLTVLPLTKISILLFYLRVFSDRTFCRIVYVVISLNVAYWIVFLLITIFQCRPISGAWTRWDGTFKGSCDNINVQGWASGAATIMLDVATLILPLPMIAKLALSRRKKVHIFLMFSVGFVLTVVSCIRLRTLVYLGNTTNPTQDYVSLGYWSAIEIFLGIICACMPAIRQLFRNVFPTLLGSTNIDSDPLTSIGASGSKRISLPLSVSPHVWHNLGSEQTSDCSPVDLEDSTKRSF